MSKAALQLRIEELERKLGESEQTVLSLASGEIDTLLRAESSTPLLLLAAQRQLTANEQLFRAVFDGAMDAMLIADEAGYYIDANPAACILFGLPREQLLGRNGAEFGNPKFDTVNAEGHLQPDGRVEGQFRVIRPDGSARDTDFRATSNILPGLQLSVLRDVTERRRNESRFRAMIERSHDGIGLVDATGVTLYASPAIARILDQTASNQQLANFELVHPEDRSRLSQLLAAVIANPSAPVGSEFRVLHRDGSTGWVAATASNFLDDPAVSAIVGNFQDITARKLAEAALRQSQRLLEEAQSIAHLGSWTSGAGPAEVVTWSAECARIFGRALHAAPTVEGFLQITHPDDRARVSAASEHVAAEGGVFETEHRILLPTGEVRWVYARTIITVHWLGEPTLTGQDVVARSYRAVGVVQDITARKRIENELRASDLRYRRIVDNTSEGVWMYDASGTTTFMNPHLAEMLGCGVEEAIGQPIFAFMDPAAEGAARARVGRRQRGVAERGDFLLKRRDGTELWVSIHADPLFNEAGEFESALALVTDITERRRADETRNRLAAIVASSDDAIISRGVDGIIRTWNRGAEKLTQYTVDEAVGQPISMLYPPEQVATLEVARSAIDAGRRTQRFEMVAVRKDGSRVDVAITSSVLLDDGGEIRGVSIVARDITERLRSEQALRLAEGQLRQAQKLEAIGSLAGGVAHDFNNLLSIILSYTSTLLDELKPSDPVRADLEEVHKAGMRATVLTRQLLAFSRHQMLQPVVMDLNLVVAGVEKMLTRLLREDIQLSLLPAPLPSNIYADAGQIEQVITNLVINARDAMPNGGNLSIETALVTLDERNAAEHVGAPLGAYVMVAVTDTGTGMDAATQQRIFEPFFTTKDKSKGTGLGLSTVYGIVQQSGGHIQVHSELGKGTTFQIYLPQTDRAAETAPVQSASSATLRGTETILLVEDEEQVLTIMRTVLRKHGYKVLEARNGGEAFLVCEQFAGTIDMLLTDVVMPRMSGRQLAERLARLRPDMKVLYMSGYTDDAITHHGVLDTGIAFLEKPILPVPLLNKVRRLLDASSQRSLPPVV